MSPALILTAGLLTPPPLTPDPQAELKRFQGAWRVVSSSENGRALPAEAVRGATFRFEGAQLTMSLNGPGNEYTVSLDPGQSPRAIDVTRSYTVTLAAGGRTLPPPPEKRTQVLPGIYAFEGDRLTICLGRAARPEKVPAEPTNGVSVFVLERQKP
jgi:uncharacterized protein (TIGR03067 family)